jgi:phosphoribosylamine--glycine ligase
MRRLSSDLLELLLALAIPGSSLPPVTWHHESALCVVLAAAGYPEKPRLGDKISGLEAAEKLKDVVVFHAGTAKNEANELVTAGGRVLGLTAVGPDIGAARRLAFKAADLIKFEGRQIRRDIGE